MLQIAICDDELYYREQIHKLLDEYGSRHCIPCRIDLYASGKEFLEGCSREGVKYDLVFLDINMEEIDGIEVARRIRAYHSDTFLAFVTAFINYALEGYKVDAVRYIMKDTLEAAVPECMDAVLEKLRVKRVAFSFVEGERKLYTDNILYVESRRHKSIFYYMDGCITTYRIYEKLDSLEGRLAQYGFLRIHKSFLVNMKHIRRISSYTAFLDTGEELPVPRPRFQAVKEDFAAYKGAF